MTSVYRMFTLFVLLVLTISAVSEAIGQAKLNRFMDDFVAGKAGNRYTNIMAAEDFGQRDVQIGEIMARLELLEDRCVPE